MTNDPRKPANVYTATIFALERWRTRNLSLVHGLFALAWIQFGLLKGWTRTPYTYALVEHGLNLLPYTWFASLAVSLALYVLPYLAEYYRRREIGLGNSEAMTFEGRTMTGSVFWDAIIFTLVFFGGLGAVAWFVVSMGQFAK